jgi:hypothetical protein
LNFLISLLKIINYSYRLGRDSLVTHFIKNGAVVDIANQENKYPREYASETSNQKVKRVLDNYFGEGDLFLLISIDMQTWLKSLGLEQYIINFFREELFLDSIR